MFYDGLHHRRMENGESFAKNSDFISTRRHRCSTCICQLKYFTRTCESPVSTMEEGDYCRFVDINNEASAYFAACGLTSWSELLEAAKPPSTSKNEGKSEKSDAPEESGERSDHDDVGCASTGAAADPLASAGVNSLDRPSKKPRMHV